MAFPRLTRLMAIAVLSAAGGLVVACASQLPTQGATNTPQRSLDSSTASFNGYDDFVDEYQATVDALSDSLPTRYAFPPEPPGEWEADADFEDGVGEMQAALYWQCAWITAYARAIASGETDSATESLDRLAAWTDLPSVTAHIDDASRELWAQSVIAPARAGDHDPLLTLGSDCSL